MHAETRWAVGQREGILGPPVVLDGLFTTVSYRLEPGGVGTRFPLTMTQLRFGRLNPQQSEGAAVEMDLIARELKVMSPARAVRNFGSPLPFQNTGMPVNPAAGSVYDYFVNSAGIPVLSVLREMVDESRRQGLPIRTVASPRGPIVSVRKLVYTIAGGAAVAAAGYIWFPEYVLTWHGLDHGPLVWVFGEIVVILASAMLVIDQMDGLGGWGDRVRGIVGIVLVLMALGLGYWGWR